MKIFIINCVILQDLAKEKGANTMGFHIAMADIFITFVWNALAYFTP